MEKNNCFYERLQKYKEKNNGHIVFKTTDDIICKIKKDISNEDIGKEIMNVLNGASGFISKKIQGKIKFKTVPRLDFFLDNSLNDGMKVLDLLEQVSHPILEE